MDKLQLCRLVVSLPRFWEDEAVAPALLVHVLAYFLHSSLCGFVMLRMAGLTCRGIEMILKQPAKTFEPFA